MTAGHQRWDSLWKSAGLMDPSDCYQRLLAHYAEPQRHYHTLQHITECLREFDAARALAQHPHLIEFAIWFHDVIYDPRAHDNEERSAQFAVECLQGAGAQPGDAESVRRLVLVTKQHIANTPDEALLSDIDLSVLGQNRERFGEYERQIRREYNWVPETVFAEKRAEILKRFLERPRIYSTEHFSTRYEQQARGNLEHSLASLQHGAKSQ
jgi:predicted metal-dependent HD superfamily phosphohydrolase